jgi:hypothetical protein
VLRRSRHDDGAFRAPLLAAADTDPQTARLQRIACRLMEYARETNETAYFQRTRELAFLAEHAAYVDSSGLSPGSTALRKRRCRREHQQSGSRALAGALASVRAESFLLDHALVTGVRCRLGSVRLHARGRQRVRVAQKLISDAPRSYTPIDRGPAARLVPRCGGSLGQASSQDGPRRGSRGTRRTSSRCWT